MCVHVCVKTDELDISLTINKSTYFTLKLR